MSYPEQYRKRTIEYRQEGHTLEETGETFKVAVTTIRRWEKQLKEKGDLKPKEVKRPFRKIDPDKLRAYIEEHPDAYQYEIAKEFGCVQSAVNQALKRLKITRKKRQHGTGNRTRKKQRNIRGKSPIFRLRKLRMWTKRA